MAAGADHPTVVAVVLNWCDAPLTAECVRSLRQSSYPSLVVLIVDNGSPDGSGAVLKKEFPELEFLQTGANLGYSGGNNRGIEWALENAADYVLVLNNDTIVDRDAVTELVEAAKSGTTVGAVAPKIVFHDDPSRIWFGGGRLSTVRALGLHIREGDRDDAVRSPVEGVSFLSGCCMLIPAPTLLDVGGFAEDFFAYVEDVELSIRLSRAGYSLLYQPAARILHHSEDTSANPSAFQIFLRDRNRRRVAARHYRLWEKVAFRCFFYPTRALQMLRYAVRLDRERAGAIWRGMTVKAS